MSDIFLSYDSRDLEQIKALAAALSLRGWVVFYDRTIPPGKTWRQFIGKEIDECRCMVVAWSNHSIESDWVLEETDVGLKRKILVPFLLEQVTPPLGFRLIQAANLVNWQGDQHAAGFIALCGAISELIAAKKDNLTTTQDTGTQSVIENTNTADTIQQSATFAAASRTIEKIEQVIQDDGALQSIETPPDNETKGKSESIADSKHEPKSSPGSTKSNTAKIQAVAQFSKRATKPKRGVSEKTPSSRSDTSAKNLTSDSLNQRIPPPRYSALKSWFMAAKSLFIAAILLLIIWIVIMAGIFFIKTGT